MENSGRSRWHRSSEISSAELLRQCGQKLTDRPLWTLFQERFQKLLFLYLLRALKFHSRREDVTALVPELAQEVYVRLVQNNGSMLRSFRGETDLSVSSFLARACTYVVADHLRHDESAKRRGNVVSIEEVREMIDASKHNYDELNVGAILNWIDIEKLIAKDPDRKNAQRNAIIFKLHFIDGLTTGEIADFSGFDLKESGVEAVILRLRKRIKQ